MKKQLRNKFLAFALSAFVVLVAGCTPVVIRETVVVTATQIPPTQTPYMVVVTATPVPATPESTEEQAPTSTPTVPANTPTAPTVAQPTAPVSIPLPTRKPTQVDLSTLKVEQFVSQTCDGYERVGDKDVRIMSVYISVRNAQDELVTGLDVIAGGETAKQIDDGRYHRVFKREGTGAWTFEVKVNGVSFGDIYVTDPCAETP